MFYTETLVSSRRDYGLSSPYDQGRELHISTDTYCIQHSVQWAPGPWIQWTVFLLLQSYYTINSPKIIKLNFCCANECKCLLIPFYNLIRALDPLVCVARIGYFSQTKWERAFSITLLNRKPVWGLSLRTQAYKGASKITFEIVKLKFSLISCLESPG